VFPSIVAIFVGAGLGAVLRWFLGLALNAFVPAMPLGTLAANLLGGYAIGIAAVVFTSRVGLPPEWRLFVITGFLGGLRIRMGVRGGCPTLDWFVHADGARHVDRQRVVRAGLSAPASGGRDGHRVPAFLCA